MASPEAQGGFSVTARLLHWLIALHMIGLIALGWWMVDLTYYSTWYNTAPWLHKAFGILVFVLGLLLLVNRFIRPAPPPLQNHKPIEKLASRVAHILLFVSILAIPVSGYVVTTSTGDPVSFFGLFDLPALFGVSARARDLAIDFHYYVSYGLLAVIGAHAAGALKHHFIDRDRTLRRMTF